MIDPTAFYLLAMAVVVQALFLAALWVRFIRYARPKRRVAVHTAWTRSRWTRYKPIPIGDDDMLTDPPCAPKEAADAGDPPAPV